MSKIYFISDLHLGHKSILGFAGQYRGNCKTLKEHDRWIVTQWNSVVKKRDKIYVLGDVAFELDSLKNLDLMNGTKILVRGNHDKFDTEVYLKYFKEIHGFTKYKDYWLSHCPIHPQELRDRKNIHGHVHMNTILDKDYINVCVELLNGTPISFEDLRGKYG